MKAIKHSPVGELRKYRDDETVTPYGMMTTLHVHVKGYVSYYDEEQNGRLVGKTVHAHRGDGAETYFRDLGNVRSEAEVRNAADQIYNQYMVGPKYNTDGTLLGSEKREAVVFQDSRKPNKGGNRPFKKNGRAQVSPDIEETDETSS